MAGEIVFNVTPQPDVAFIVEPGPEIEVVQVGEGQVALTVVENPAPVFEVTLTEAPQIAEVEVSGPPGPQGIPGPQGPPGESGDAYCVHVQDTPTADVEYEHGLGKNPSVTVLGSDGAIWEPDVSYPVENETVRLVFGGAMTFRAFNS